MALAPVALLVSPRLAGHRQVYCRVLGEMLHGLGYRVVVASADAAANGQQINALHSATGAESVTLDERWVNDGGDRAALRRLIRQTRASVVLLTEADDHLSLLLEGVGRGESLPARLIGIFIRTTSFVHGARRNPSMRTTLRRPTLVLQRQRLFHDVLVPRRRLLDAALCLDEVFVAARGHPYHWLPDIYRTFQEQDGSETSAWRGVLADRLTQNRDRPVVVYVGAPQRRRGYVDLLRLAVERNACFLHCGIPPHPKVEAVACSLRATLASRGTLLETGDYYREYGTARAFLEAARCVVLPYVDHFGASGVMLQAIEAGRPVIVPDLGLMAYRVKAHGLGATYDPQDSMDLGRVFERLERQGPEAYRNDLRRFMQWFSRQQVTAAIANAIGVAPSGAVLPRYRGSGR